MRNKKCHVITAWRHNLQKVRYVVSGQKEMKAKVEELKAEGFITIEILDVCKGKSRRIHVK